MKTNSKNIIGFSSVVILIFLFSLIVQAKTANAANSLDQSKVINTKSVTVNGVTRTMSIVKGNNIYLTVEDTDLYIYSGFTDVGFDKNGVIWIYDTDHYLKFYNWDYQSHYFAFVQKVPSSISDSSSSYVSSVNSLLYDDNGYVTGYTTFSGNQYPVLTMEEMRSILPVINNTTIDYTPSKEEKESARDVARAKKASAYAVYGGSYVYLYVKGVVTKKIIFTEHILIDFGKDYEKQYRNVRDAGFTKTKHNIIYLTKKGTLYTINKKGKRKRIATKIKKLIKNKNHLVYKALKKKKNKKGKKVYINISKK